MASRNPDHPNQLHFDDVDLPLMRWEELLRAGKIRIDTPIRREDEDKPFAKVSGIRETPRGGFSVGVHFLPIDPKSNGGFYGYSQLIDWDDDQQCLVVSKPLPAKRR